MEAQNPTPIQSLELKNFTAFDHITVEFSSGVNVLVGANGTGKTHILKALYSLIYGPSRQSSSDYHPIFETFTEVFLPLDKKPGRLIRDTNIEFLVRANIVNYGTLTFSFPSKLVNPSRYGDIFALTKQFGITDKYVIFFPCKDIIGHARGLRSLLKQYDLDFDKTYRDIIDLAFLPSVKQPNLLIEPILEKLQTAMQGYIPQVQEDQYFLSQGGKQIEFSLVAEGWRKLAVFWHVLRNFSFLKPSNPIFWDEPEANLNPKALSLLAECFAMLSRLGFQIILATHSYVLLRELEIHQAKDLNFISLYHEDGTIKAKNASSYNDIHKNLIEEENERLYYQEIGVKF